MIKTGAPGRVTVSLAMIVKDEETNLAACLDSARGLFDETVVVDTGSADGTVEVARSFGARVFRFAWCDDFSAARNFGLDQVRTDWVFRLDADDRIPAGQHDPLRAVLDSLRRDRPEAITFRVEAAGSPGGPMVVSDEIRLWPNLPTLRFAGRVHEQIGSSLQGAGVSSRPCDVRLEHLGYNDAAIVRHKLERNERLILLDLAVYPNNPASLFELGRCRWSLGNPRGALDSLLQSLDRMPIEWDLYARVAFRLVVQLHYELGDSPAALAACRTGLARYPDDAHLAAQAADLLAFAGQLDQAAEGYRKVLALGAPDRMEAGADPQFRARVAAALAEVEARRAKGREAEDSRRSDHDR
jgi:glycosyltransferase involved in cell wall biosynthesis